MSRNEAAELVKSVIAEISDALERGEIVKISKVGSFAARRKGQRVGRNPKTGWKRRSARAKSWCSGPIDEACVGLPRAPSIDTSGDRTRPRLNFVLQAARGVNPRSPAHVAMVSARPLVKRRIWHRIRDFVPPPPVAFATANVDYRAVSR